MGWNGIGIDAVSTLRLRTRVAGESRVGTPDSRLPVSDLWLPVTPHWGVSGSPDICQTEAVGSECPLAKGTGDFTPDLAEMATERVNVKSRWLELVRCGGERGCDGRMGGTRAYDIDVAEDMVE
jgi:hypothetical protein